MNRSNSILVVDDNTSILKAVEILLTPRFGRVVTLSHPERIPSVLQAEKPDAVLLDMNFKAGINNGNEGLFWLREIKKIDNSVQVVLFTAYADIDLAVRGLQEGACDFVVKPFSNEKLLSSLQNACLRKQGEFPDRPQTASHEDEAANQLFWGESEAMQTLRSSLEHVAITDANVLITGENGTGKGLLAVEIHRFSKRRNHALVTVDMGAITESLFESELFGHVKGAFTDARQDRVGKFELAHQGTLFLDEIGNLAYHLQSKLLTALQQKSIVRVGGNTPVNVNMRVVCATNRNLRDMVRQGTFREDLFYRINTVELMIPALRERPQDIAPLAQSFAQKYGTLYGKPGITLNKEALNALTAYPWPGNIRELEHVVEKAVIMADAEVLGADHFEMAARSPDILPLQGIHETGDMRIEDMECLMIRQAISKYGGNLSAVANALGIARQTLYSKIKKYGL